LSSDCPCPGDCPATPDCYVLLLRDNRTSKPTCLSMFLPSWFSQPKYRSTIAASNIPFIVVVRWGFSETRMFMAREFRRPNNPGRHDSETQCSTPHPTSPGSSPGGPTISHKIHGLMASGSRDCPFPIIPWSEAPLMEFMELCHWDQGIGIPWRGAWWGAVMVALPDSPSPEIAEMIPTSSACWKQQQQQYCDRRHIISSYVCRYL